MSKINKTQYYFYQTFPVWFWISAISLTIRIPLLFLPNPGRDEAAYFYWSRYPEPAYALLMQVVVRLFNFLPIPDLFAMRFPAFLMGISVIFMFDKLLQLRGVNYKFRFLALLLFAFSPWQSNFGVLLNPDNFLLATILLFLIAFVKEKYSFAAVWTGIAIFTKPIGVLVIPAAWIVFFMLKNVTAIRKLLYYSVTLVFVFLFLLSIKKEMLNALFEFGKLDPSVSFIGMIFIQIGLLIVGGGPLLIFYAGVGIVQRIKQQKLTNNLRLENLAVLTLSIIMFIVFTIALLFNSQVKYNWILPVFVILWPTKKIHLKKYILIPGLVLSIGFGIFQNIVKMNPQIAAEIENFFPGLKSTFIIKGGVRESRVSTSRSWTNHMLEYHTMKRFTQSVKKIWNQSGRNKLPIKWIISDDYGLASQLVFELGNENIRMIIPGDGVFIRTIPSKKKKVLSGGVLILAVQNDLQSNWNRIENIEEKYQISHPVTNQLISIGVLSDFH